MSNLSTIITGSKGLIGSAVTAGLSNNYSFTSLDVSDPVNPVDITNYDQVIHALENASASKILHLAAFTDVTAAWQQTGDKKGLAYQVNVSGTENLVKACNSTGKQLIHISTAYVFDGEKATPYTEEDTPAPIEWYGETKALAEQAVQEQSDNWVILRIDSPFRPNPFAKLDIAHKIVEQLRAGSLPPQFDDHYFGPTWVPDFVTIVDWILSTDQHGIYHASSGESWTNFDFARVIAETIGSKTKVQAGSLKEYLKTQERPYQKNTALNCDKLFRAMEFEPTPINEAIKQLVID